MSVDELDKLMLPFLVYDKKIKLDEEPKDEFVAPEEEESAEGDGFQLKLIDDQNARNWEAIARLDNLGYLLATDKYPETIFAFVSNARP